MYYRAVLIWFLFSILATLNGIMRNSFINPVIGEHNGHIVSTVILSLLIFFVTLSLIKWISPKNRKEAAGIGLLWVLMTIAFEFLAGHYLFGHSWDRLLADYDLAKGRFWVLVLIVTYFAPVWSAKVKKIN
ncbi:MAG: hypothetical protein JW746_06290 [Candidatus Krumholzibacteriota bacterium]|nr:hypothetical protein [Candidatus Krumholzibacteriota bacterium]